MTKPLRTPSDEEHRYAAVAAQCEQLRADASIDFSTRGFAVNLARAILHAELYEKNETAHMAYYARHGIILALQQRIQQENTTHA